MADDPFYKAHWQDIEPERMSAYKGGFAWDEAASALYAGADIHAGQAIADFGCGPGKVAAALAGLVGETGYVYAIDIKEAFLKIARENAVAAGVADWVTTHQSDGATLPFDDGTLDRVTARNTIMYVDDPVETLGEFRRVLRPGGLAHAIDGDWYMMVAEPVAHDLWRDFVRAASHACRNADMGRQLYGAFREAGFEDIQVKIFANPDVTGRLLGMVRNMARYALESGTLDAAAIDRVIAQVEQGLADGRYFLVSPQFVVTGRAPD
ncbi:methyltransferase domain-containing protein [Sulfitobacter aestuariivivens]|uniref:Methyltransferase domain-containing protein n=1 Tax=Sulfitobacter aestuariivivens TaxID=2766981 RepID=A0A927HG90_9RHOB|nr:methyltransferase domain-containing protein [Sulfitobacter aestuariivivens]MBD3665711.1 methyltransferase domain-containing protein [Sulfitobacter aestuariivivens]